MLVSGSFLLRHRIVAVFLGSLSNCNAECKLCETDALPTQLLRTSVEPCAPEVQRTVEQHYESPKQSLFGQIDKEEETRGACDEVNSEDALRTVLAREFR